MNRYQELQIQLSKKLSGDFLGNFCSAFLGAGREFVNLREYVAGDSVKTIDWNTTAKHNKTFVKNYEQERDISALFIFDITESFLFGSKYKTKLETCEEVFFLLAQAASKGGFQVGSLLGEQYLKPKHGAQNIALTIASLDQIRETENIPEGHWKQSLQGTKNHLICIFSDRIQDIDRNLALHNDIVYIHIFDRLEQFGTAINFSSYLGGIWTYMSQGRRQTYREKRDASLKQFRSKLLKAQIRSIELSDQSDITLELYKFFHSPR